MVLAYSWAMPTILVAGKSRGGMFLFFCFFTFTPLRLSSLSLSFISSTISSISFLPFSGRRHKMTHKGWRVVKPPLNQSLVWKCCPCIMANRNSAWNTNCASHTSLLCPNRSKCIPAGTWRKYNVASTSMQRHDVASTLRRRCIYGTWRKYNVASTSMQRQDVASTLKRRCIYVMCPRRCIDVEATLYLRHVPAGIYSPSAIPSNSDLYRLAPVSSNYFFH